MDAWAFRCCAKDHGPTVFANFSPSHLDQMAGQLCSFGEVNILILGETGVGKTTWINAFANYLTYGTLEHALKVREFMLPATNPPN
jgi:predicted GTPase